MLLTGGPIRIEETSASGFRYEIASPNPASRWNLTYSLPASMVTTESRDPRLPCRASDDFSCELALTSAFDRPSVAVDVVLLTATEGSLRVLAVRRHEHPAKGALSLPGGFVRMDESLDEAADRVIVEKAGLTDVFVEQLYTFGDVARDPRTRVISVTYYALVDPARLVGAPALDTADRCILRVDVPWEGETGG